MKEKAKESALKRSISGAQVLHLASHGKLDSENPMRSAVYLTPGAKEDGRFEVSEIIGQKLNADLVVLSACDTSNGQVVNGEGMMSLSWAFLAAGSRSVLATQWSVDSKSAARDIVLFYEQMLAGKNKAEAIQAVMKKQISARPPFNHPSYWAGYVSIGDFR